MRDDSYCSMGLNPDARATCGWPKCGHLLADGNTGFGWCLHTGNRAEPSDGMPLGFTPSVSYSGGCDFHTAITEEERRA